MKLLLLTDMPPCGEFTAGLVLDRLCRFLPKGSLACFAAVRPEDRARISADLGDVPVVYRQRPRELAVRLLPSRLGGLTALAAEGYKASVVVPRIAAEAVAFGREQKVDAVWAVLEGQTLIRLALPVARGLGVPLYSQVFDPPSWWLRDHGVDRVSAARIEAAFARALQGSEAVAAISRPMAQHYRDAFGVRAVAVPPGLDARLALPPAGALHEGPRLVIGVAGQIYARREFEALLAALASAGWRLDGRDVAIRLTGRRAELATADPVRVEYLGWAPTQEETVRLMAEADILYCPCWFDPAFEAEARYCFPSKLPTYLAAGRPVLFHGPAYASGARLLSGHDAGLCCASPEPEALGRALGTLAGDAALYARLARNGAALFRSELTGEAMRESFFEFLGLPPSPSAGGEGA